MDLFTIFVSIKNKYLMEIKIASLNLLPYHVTPSLKKSSFFDSLLFIYAGYTASAN